MPVLIAGLPFAERLQPFLPSAHVIAIVTPWAAAYALLAGWLAGQLRTARQVRTAYTRKIFHFLVFTMAGVVQLLWQTPGVVVFGAVVSLFVFHAVWRGAGYPLYEALARPNDAPHQTTFILVPWVTTALGGFVSNLIFPGFASVGYLVCGWGDAVGEPVGTRFGKHLYRVPSFAGVPATRSLEGSIAVLAFGTGAAVVSLMMDGFAWQTALRVGAFCGLCAALIEAISTHGLDNLTTQITASGIAYVLLS
ncbi:MAG TPA: hypothetical protein VK864_16745 [Longimicrobiales bacterium]|nr:hypothetical protein [Longimicrobiales bacterium]